MFGAEDQMNQNFGEGLRHRGVALGRARESWGWLSSQGVAPL
jgi:hypothetical protein